MTLGSRSPMCSRSCCVRWGFPWPRVSPSAIALATSPYPSAFRRSWTPARARLPTWSQLRAREQAPQNLHVLDLMVENPLDGFTHVGAIRRHELEEILVHPDVFLLLGDGFGNGVVE